MLKNKAEVELKRKRIVNIIKTIGKLTTEHRQIAAEIDEYEKSCRHIWSKRTYDKRTDRFTRTCDLCSKEQISKE